MKTDVCGATTTATLADKAATVVDFTVSAMTGKDQCSYTVKATCDLPVVTVKTATGGFLDSSKVMVTFIEGTSETLDTMAEPAFGTMSCDGKEGQFYPVCMDTKSAGDPVKASMIKYLDDLTQSQDKIMDF